MSGEPQGRNRGHLAALAGVGLLLLWGALNYLYFFHSNLALVHSEEFRLGVFSALFGPWTFSLQNSPPLEMLQALIVTGLVFGLGYVILRVLRLRLSWPGSMAAAYALGWGIAGFAFILLTMARLLYMPLAWLLWALLFAGGIYLVRKLQPVFESDDTPPQIEPLPPLPSSMGTRVFLVLAAIGVGLITLFTFWHAIFYPETYWDSLILYLGYARMTFLEGGFPFKAEAQVGIGLGANYPHLYSNYGAFASTMFADWSDMHQRLAAPLSGLFSCVFVYLTAAHLFRSHAVAAACTILFRSLPNGIAYTTYASDYAFAIFYTAAFIYFGTLYFLTRGRGALVAFTLMPAIGMNLNYLMGILWVPWLVVILADWLWRRGAGARAFYLGRFFICTFAVCLAISVPWYVRNWVLTGNPVYAFFPEVFTTSVRVNPDVLRSAEIEWFRVGDGVGKLAEFYHDLHHGRDRDEGHPDYQRKANNLHWRLRGSWPFWFGYDILKRVGEGEEFPALRTAGWPARLYRLASFTTGNEDYRQSEQIAGRIYYVWPHHYKMAPKFPGFFIPVFLLLPFVGAAWIVLHYRRTGRMPESETALPLLLIYLTAAGYMGYKYLLADFYLYQIIGIMAPAAVLAGLPFHWLKQAMQKGGTQLNTVYTALAAGSAAMLLAILVTPGLTFGLMGFKFSGAREVEGQHFNQLALDAFRNPGMPPDLFLRLRYGTDVDTWEFANEHLTGQRLLTHENRHYVLDPSITIVQLDDWDIQAGYEIDDPAERARFLREQGIEYYLRIPNEFRHPINAELGMHELEDKGFLEFVYSPDMSEAEYRREEHKFDARVFFRILLPEEMTE